MVQRPRVYRHLVEGHIGKASGVDRIGGECRRVRPGLKPVAIEVEETVVGPVARGGEEDDEEKGAVHAWPVEEVCAHEKEADEYW